MEDPFVESDGVRLALARGADPADPARFVEALIDIVDNPEYSALMAHLRSVGLSVGQLVDLVEPARVAEASKQFTASGQPPDTLCSPEARAVVTQLHPRGFTVKQLAALLQVDENNVERFLSSRGTKIDEALVLQLHAEGKTPLQIENETGMSRVGAFNALHRLGLTPHVTKGRVDKHTREKIIRLRNDGADYPTIRTKTGVTTSQITSVLRLAARKHLVNGYGEKAA